MQITLKGSILNCVSGTSSDGNVYAYVIVLSGDETVRLYFDTRVRFWKDKFDSLVDLDRLSPVEIDADFNIRKGVAYFTIV